MTSRGKTKPSQVSEDFWIFAQRRTGGYPPATTRSGKWLLFVPRDQVDEVWSKVELVLDEGRLGDIAKVSTTRPNRNASDPENHVICVYTYDSEDVEDVMRIRQVLRDMGFTNKIPYKTDEATLAGRYRVRGDRNVSKYYC
jgi:hypothetical protein